MIRSGPLQGSGSYGHRRIRNRRGSWELGRHRSVGSAESLPARSLPAQIVLAPVINHVHGPAPSQGTDTGCAIMRAFPGSGDRRDDDGPAVAGRGETDTGASI
jgi:hypothetical protein